MTLNHLRLSSHFSLNEFECTCCQRVKLDPRLLTILENVRAYIGKPVIVTSGYRCYEHNRNVGGASDSDHLYGWAADIVVAKMQPEELANIVGFYLKDGRIITYSDKRCVHIGVQHRDGYPDRLHVTPKMERMA